MKRSLLVCLLVLAANILYARQPDSLRIKFRAMAEKGGYGILLAQVGTDAVTTMSTGFKGLYEIDLRSARLDTVCSSPLLADAASQKALMDLSHTLVSRGVRLRTEGAVREAVLCYRLPLYTVCIADERPGMDIVSRNLWTAKEELKYEVSSKEIKETDELLKGDASYLLGRFGKTWETQLSAPDAPFEVFLLYRRLADFSYNAGLRKKIMQSKLQSPGSMEDSRLLTAVMEDMAQAGLEDLLIDSISNTGFKQTWNAFLKYRTSVPEQNVTFFRNLFYNTFRSLNLAGIAAASAGGPFGHKLSYAVSGYIQEIGRDIVLFDLVNKKPLDALVMSENTRAKALNEWLGRNHRNRMYGYKALWGLRNYAVGKPWLRQLDIDDIYVAAKTAGSPLLTFMKLREQYVGWLILPDGKVLYGIYENVDTLCSQLFRRLPYNFNVLSPSARPGAVTRGLEVEPEQTPGQTASLYKELYSKLILPRFREELNGDKTGKLIVIPDGTLQYIPFAALQDDNGRYLVQDREISYWPSVQSGMILSDAAETFKYEEASADKAGEAAVKIFANPDFSGKYYMSVNGAPRPVSFAPLPGTADEAATIGALFNVKPLVQREARTSEFSGKMKYSILHLATHGLLNTEDPMRSFVALSDGPLYAEDLYNEQFIIKARLVVLSACQTALGSFTGDSPIGLNNAFLIGGANCTVASLWAVDDQATRQLMQVFYNGIKMGNSISAALRAAQLDLLNQGQWSSPRFLGCIQGYRYYCKSDG